MRSGLSKTVRSYSDYRNQFGTFKVSKMIISRSLRCSLTSGVWTDFRDRRTQSGWNHLVKLRIWWCHTSGVVPFLAARLELRQSTIGEEACGMFSASRVSCTAKTNSPHAGNLWATKFDAMRAQRGTRRKEKEVDRLCGPDAFMQHNMDLDWTELEPLERISYTTRRSQFSAGRTAGLCS